MNSDPAAALADPFGHGTHVAGIIAGAAPADPGKVLIAANEPSSGDLPVVGQPDVEPGRTLSGIAPKARLVSLKVLDASGNTVIQRGHRRARPGSGRSTPTAASWSSTG